MVQVLGKDFQTKIFQKLFSLFFQSYHELFADPMNNTLESVEKRHGWLFRHMKEFGTKFEKVFPEHWGIEIYLVYEFTGLTRIVLQRILEDNQKPVVSVLMSAL